MKNPSPRQIVLRATLLVVLLVVVLEVIPSLLPVLNDFRYHLLLVPILMFGLTYLIFYRVVENFIYRKIKLIYKNIHNLKTTKNVVESRLDLSTDIIGAVNKEVLNWAEASRKEISQLRSMENYRKEYLGNVSHELKTPITSIQGYLETLIDGGINDPRINMDYLSKAIRNVERMVSIINDLESISHLESGQLKLQMQPFDMNALTKEVFSDLEIQAAQRNIRLKIKEGCDRVFMVEADKKMIREVLVNLITNSIKYGKDNGQTNVGFYNMGDNILVEASDTGIGIGKEDLSRVFERFFRVEKSRSRDFGGTGLGLSIVKHVIEAHNQTITVRSTPNEGSTFAFTLRKAD
ncbi:MAG: sensor histidine kinase [Chitinophagales bacterium]|nr:sensor histidine kinase [Chitinophagales bacterium]HAE34540.1 two-component sensor histidine kinase [Bacteroidota bacterium]MCB9021593.1 sensor histidine kinase [Chitinophagales bacterium]MCB9031154.1 sensor histidine kinase [Chitinophagales bacterium]HPE96995.1 ATP-binding protein [Chitinophagales bacterium]